MLVDIYMHNVSYMCYRSFKNKTIYDSTRRSLVYFFFYYVSDFAWSDCVCTEKNTGVRLCLILLSLSFNVRLLIRRNTSSINANDNNNFEKRRKRQENSKRNHIWTLKPLIISAYIIYNHDATVQVSLLYQKKNTFKSLPLDLYLKYRDVKKQSDALTYKLITWLRISDRPAEYSFPVFVLSTSSEKPSVNRMKTVRYYIIGFYKRIWNHNSEFITWLLGSFGIWL